ncbi:MAG: guanylate kinase [Sphingobacteriia bacterium]|nr:guanylate kinase [Sphingobacteriia bacterium]
MGKLVVFSAPSGAGKTSVVNGLLSLRNDLMFSVSATSRDMRPGEIDGKNYYFISPDEFRSKIDKQDFVEWEEVYAGSYYGTLKSELERIWNQNCHVLFDVDVKGGVRLKELFAKDTLAIFIAPPSLEVLEQRLRGRNTESEESLAKRLGKAKWEMEFSSKFDYVVVNDDLSLTIEKVNALISDFLAS